MVPILSTPSKCNVFENDYMLLLADESTIMPLTLHLFSRNLPSCWQTPAITILVGTEYRKFANFVIHSIWSVLADKSTLMPLQLHLFARNSPSCWQISWFTVKLQMMLRCIDWGPKPTWNGFYMHSIHRQYVLDHSYGVNLQMDPPSRHYLTIFAGAE